MIFPLRPFGVFDIVYIQKRMKKNTLFFIGTLILGPVAADAATCSTANLRRCLDSACAIGITSNPAARCQYCGQASAGGVPKSTLKNTSLPSKNTLSDKELKNAPTDSPGARYVWATTECIKKNAGCTPDDVTDVYDELISASCRAAGISAKIDATLDETHQGKTQPVCQTDITICMNEEKRCGADFSRCATDALFDQYFAECGVESTGCGEFLTAIRTDIAAQRETAVADTEKILTDTVQAHQTNRTTKFTDAKNACADDTARQQCIQARCAENMPNKCAPDFPSERAAATLLCKFHELACDRLTKGDIQ